MSDYTASHYICSALSSTVALVVGTGLSYYLFIHRHLVDLELYKEKVKVYKKVDNLITRVILSTENLRTDPSSVGPFGASLEAFNRYVTGENGLFVPDSVGRRFADLEAAQERVVPTQYQDPVEPARPEDRHLVGLIAVYRSLQKAIELEIKEPQSKILEWAMDFAKRLKADFGRLMDDWKQGGK